MIADIKCPRCQADAIYGYGHVHNGKQRYLCLLCNRQFITEWSRPVITQRPLCPLCGGRMHVYMRGTGRQVRFRCADYPVCRGFSKKAL